MGKDIVIHEIMSKDIFMNVLKEYYSVKLRKEAHFEIELGVKYTDITVLPDIKIYYVQYVMGDKISVLVKDCEIAEALRIHAANRGFEFISFNYRGTVRRAGYAYDEDTPIFEGIVLHMKKRDKIRTRKR